MDKQPKTGNMDDIYSATGDLPEEFDLEIDNNWAKVAKQSRERWSKDNPAR